MGISSEQFLQLRAEEVAVMYDHTFTKKEAILTGKRMVDNLIEDGDIDPKKVWANIVRLKEVINSADAYFRESLYIFEKESINGVEFTPVQGGETLNYKEDKIYLQLHDDLRIREELLKLARKSNNDLFDQYGNVVPKVSTSPRKSSITVKF
ncbi:MAG TPA: hypothetical protein DCM02_08155 [Flavobacterium sp.]|nr:hypothetical protein [Flavobacterium sp.]